jgi:hypothetical protein
MFFIMLCKDKIIKIGFLIVYTPGRLSDVNPCKLESVLTTANAAETNSLTCLPRHGGTQDYKFLVTHPMTGLKNVA